jgi:hypothetical protein
MSVKMIIDVNDLAALDQLCNQMRQLRLASPMATIQPNEPVTDCQDVSSELFGVVSDRMH